MNMQEFLFGHKYLKSKTSLPFALIAGQTNIDGLWSDSR